MHGGSLGPKKVSLSPLLYIKMRTLLLAIALTLLLALSQASPTLHQSICNLACPSSSPVDCSEAEAAAAEKFGLNLHSLDYSLQNAERTLRRWVPDLSQPSLDKAIKIWVLASQWVQLTHSHVKCDTLAAAHEIVLDATIERICQIEEFAERAHEHCRGRTEQLETIVAMFGLSPEYERTKTV